MHVCHINLAKGFRGGERQTLLLIRALSGIIDQTVVIRKNARIAPFLEQIPGIRILAVSKPFFTNLPRFRSADLIHAHEAKGGHLAFFSQIMYQIPYVITRRVMTPPKNAWFFKAVYTRASAVVAVSSHIRKMLDNLDSRMRLTVIPDSHAGLETDPVNAAAIRRKYRRKFLVGHVGALLNKDKGQSHIIGAAKKIAAIQPDIHFIFLGEGPDRDRFLNEARGYPNMEFTGFTPHVGDYLSCFDLFVFPSLNEGLGSSILDAFYFTLPVIATRVGGIPDIITHGKNGILVNPGDDAALAEAVLSLYHDPDLRRRLGHAAGRSLDRFHIDVTSAQYHQRYREIIDSQKKAAF